MQFHLLACLDGLYGYVLLILRPGKKGRHHTT
eukprot:COSAG04_NODE_3673_length_2616_cov_1.307509_3_plen_32_part_00